jgi:hypothetical protein
MPECPCQSVSGFWRPFSKEGIVVMPTFTDFFVQNLWFFVTGGCITVAGLIGAVLYVHKQGEREHPE